MSTAISLRSSHVFEGNDGPWSMFQIGVGSAQNPVNVLPANSLNYLIVSDSSFCAGYTEDALTNCRNLRGGLFDSSSSTSFYRITNPTSTNGLFKLPFPDESSLHPLQCSDNCNNTGVGYFANASSLFGTDNITLAHAGGNDIGLSQQVVAPYAGAEPDLGFLGLDQASLNFSYISGVQTYSSPLQTLWDDGLIPSRYWAYSAGSKQLNIDGSLTIGGYDRRRGDIENAPYWNFVGGSRNLGVEVRKISLRAESSSNFTPSPPYYAYIDTTVPELWLPIDTCKAFEFAFGLTWNETWYMYLLNESHHQALLDLNPSVSFTIGGSNFDGSDDGQIFTLTYASFDLEAGWPLAGIGADEIGTTAYYFPLKRADNDAQLTLGRAFFQETYLAVDYDHSRFAIASTSSQISGPPDIVTVNNRNQTGLSSGAIAGIVVAGVVVLLAIILIAFVAIRKRRKRRPTFENSTEGRQPPQMEETLPGPLRTFFETDGKPKVQAQSPELGTAYPKAELQGSQPDPRDRNRTWSGSTLPISPMSQGNRRGHNRTLSEESQVHSIQSRESQQSHGFPLPSPPEELEAPGPHELEGWRPGEVDASPPERLEAPRRTNGMPSRFVIQS